MTTAAQATAQNAARATELLRQIQDAIADMAAQPNLDWSHAGSTGKAVEDLTELARFFGIAA